MKLDFKQITDITQGSMRIEKDNGAVSFYRFNKEEQDLYSKTEFFKKTFSTAGVQMEFQTDGSVLNLSIETSDATSRTYFSMDIFVNGGFISSIKNFDDSIAGTVYSAEKFQMGIFEKSISLGNGSKTVRIVFPWSVKTELKEISIENASFVTPVHKDKTILFYGDSITGGYDALYPSKTYAAQLADSMGAEMYNKAIGGEMFFPQLAKIKSEIKPDHIVVAYGTNDWSMSEKDDFCRRCKDFFDNLSENYPEAAIYALTPIWRKDFESDKIFGDFCDVEKTIKCICKDFKNVKVISGWNFVPHDERFYADLRLHPNDIGFKHYFNELKKEISKL